jgi:hypothetical protein
MSALLPRVVMPIWFLLPVSSERCIRLVERCISEVFPRDIRYLVGLDMSDRAPRVSLPIETSDVDAVQGTTNSARRPNARRRKRVCQGEARNVWDRWRSANSVGECGDLTDALNARDAHDNR